MAGLMQTALRGEKADAREARIPVWCMRQAGRYLPEYRALREKKGSFLALLNDPVAAAEVTMQPLRRFEMDAAVVFSDILIVLQALGAELTFVAGEGPILRAGDSLSKTLDKAPLQSTYETLKRVRSALSKDKSLIGFAGAPFTLFAYLKEGKGSRDFLAARRALYNAPEESAEVLARLSESTAEHLLLQVEAGADVLQLFDTHAALLTPALYERFALPALADLHARLKAAAPMSP